MHPKGAYEHHLQAKESAEQGIYKVARRTQTAPVGPSKRIFTGYKGTHGTFIGDRRVAGKGEDDQ
jgi:hypothetical protein